MNTNELKRQIFLIKNQENAKIAEARTHATKERELVLDNWAISNAKFHIGDIICSHNLIIRVDRINGGYIPPEEPYVIYSGPALTKQLEERKDGSRMPIYDDSPDRNIHKIPEKK